MYYWKAKSDDGAYEERSKTSFATMQEAYQDMREAVLQKMKWNTEYDDFSDGTLSIGYAVTFMPKTIIHTSYSGRYVYEIFEEKEMPKELREWLYQFIRLSECGGIRSYYDTEAPSEYRYADSSIVFNFLFCAEEMACKLDDEDIHEAEAEIRAYVLSTLFQFLDFETLKGIRETVDAYYTVNKEVLETEKIKELKEQLAWLNTLLDWGE